MMTNGFHYFLFCLIESFSPVCCLLLQRQIQINALLRVKASPCFSISYLRKNHREILLHHARKQKIRIPTYPPASYPAKFHLVNQLQRWSLHLCCFIFAIFDFFYPHFLSSLVPSFIFSVDISSIS